MHKNRFNIEWIDSVDSTNNEAKRRIESLAALSVISAREQTSGRGQGCNTWLTEPDKNLTFSIVIKYNGALLPYVTPADQIVITQIISLTIVELLTRYGIYASIKWPNDIYVGNNKICGVLIEHAVRGTSLLHSIIGVGLNVNQCEFDECLTNPTSILLEKGGTEKDLQSMLEEILEIFLKYAECDVEELDDSYHSNLR